MKAKLLTATQIAAELGVPGWQVRYVLRTRKVKPVTTLGVTRVFGRWILPWMRNQLAGIDVRRGKA